MDEISMIFEWYAFVLSKMHRPDPLSPDRLNQNLIKLKLEFA
jgi:hypothetical protein